MTNRVLEHTGAKFPIIQAGGLDRPLSAGQTVGLIDEVKSAQAIIDETVAQFHAITGRLGALAAARGF